jgi:hypothetical protein
MKRLMGADSLFNGEAIIIQELLLQAVYIYIDWKQKTVFPAEV